MCPINNPNWGNSGISCSGCFPDSNKNATCLMECGFHDWEESIGGGPTGTYLVNNSNDDPLNPTLGTLRHAASQDASLLILFTQGLKIVLKQPLSVKSSKNIDARGLNVHITGGCILLENAKHVNIQGLNIHDCTRQKTFTSVGGSKWSYGDAILIIGSADILINGNSFSYCSGTHISARDGSSNINILNNEFSHQQQVMVLGSDVNPEDKKMLVTIRGNSFGPGLVRDMPRCNSGVFHINDNVFCEWETDCLNVGPSALVSSKENKYFASDNDFSKQVLKLLGASQSSCTSEDDLFYNKAVFKQPNEPAKAALVNDNAGAPVIATYRLLALLGHLLLYIVTC